MSAQTSLLLLQRGAPESYNLCSSGTAPPIPYSMGSGFSLLANYRPGARDHPPSDGGLSHEADGLQLSSSQLSEIAHQPPAREEGLAPPACL